MDSTLLPHAGTALALINEYEIAQMRVSNRTTPVGLRCSQRKRVDDVDDGLASDQDKGYGKTSLASSYSPERVAKITRWPGLFPENTDGSILRLSTTH